MSTPDERDTEGRAPSKPLDPDDPIDRVRMNTSKARADHRPARHVDTPDEAVARAHDHRRRLGLTSWIFIALGLGLLCGVLFHYLVPAGPVRDDIFVNGIFYLVGQGFLRLMQMLVVPLVFCSIVCGAASIGDTKTLGSIGVKTILFYLFTTAMAVAVALGVASLINPGRGVDMGSVAPAEAVVASVDDLSIADTVLNIVPQNPIGSLANGDMLPIIFFALFCGLVIAILGKRVETVHRLFEQFNEIMMKMTSLVMYVAPLGVFCILARTFAGIGFDAFLPMLKYMGGVAVALAIQCFGVYMLLLLAFTRLNPLVFLKKFFPVMAFAFSTATSNATIPMNISYLERRIGVSRRVSSFTIPLGATINMDGTAIMQGVAVVFTAHLERRIGVSRRVSSFTIPLGATINMDGTAIMQGVAVVFTAQLFGVDLGPADYATVIATATLASIGTAGVPSVGLITLSMVFNSVGLPLEGIALIMGIDRILDMLRTAVNITGDAVVTTIVAKQSGAMDPRVYRDPEAGADDEQDETAGRTAA